jgi:hypothetical protein
MQFSPPFTMMDFFRRSEGNWFTQRSIHHFDAIADESGESNLFVSVIEPTDFRVQSICAQQGIGLAAGGASFIWQANLDDREPNPNDAALLIDVPDDESGLSGSLFRDRGYVEKIPVISRYWFAKDGLLTIETEYDNHQGQERCWFVNEDFRVRVSTVRIMNGVNLMTYCSERRCLSVKSLEQMVHHNRVRHSALT